MNFADTREQFTLRTRRLRFYQQKMAVAPERVEAYRAIMVCRPRPISILRVGRSNLVR